MRKTRSMPDIDTRRALEGLAREVRGAYSLEWAFPDVAGTSLVGAGNARMACCPFHEDRNPSLSVDLSKGVYKCHSAGCGAQGDVFTLLMSAYDMSFREAVLHAAALRGVPIPDGLERTPGGAGAEPKRRATIRYPDDRARQVPEGLQPADLAALPLAAQLPQPGQAIATWDPSRADGQRLRRFTPEMVHVYRNREGRPLVVLLRCLGRKRPDGKQDKFFIPLRPAECAEAHPGCAIPGAGGPLRWLVGGMADMERRPLYGLEGLKPGSPVRKILVIEGEKTADAARRMLVGAGSDMAVLSPMGGGASPLRSDWTPLLDLFGAGDPIEILIWPDADKLMKRPDGVEIDRQEKFVVGVATGLHQALADAGIAAAAAKVSRIVPPGGVESGWDLADAENEGWDGERLLAHADVSMRDIAHETLPVKAPHAPKADADTAARKQDDEETDPMSEMFDELDSLVPSSQAGAAAGSGASEEARNLPAEDVDGLADGGPGLIDDEDQAGGGDDADIPESLATIMDNPHFRPLGHNSGTLYFASLESGHIFSLTPQMLRSNYLIMLADKEWWRRHFPKRNERGLETGNVDWDDASNALVRCSYSMGVWDPSKERGQGTYIDGGRVVFNTGTMLYVEGEGLVPIRDYRSNYCYTMGLPTPMPDFGNPFSANDPDVLRLLGIIQSLNWKTDRRELSVLGLFGWMCVGPIGGILSWRPHLWLDGPRSAGKSWVMQNIVGSVLGDYAHYATSNSTEPGLRHELHAKAFPLIFDEAEGETRGDRDRIDAIIKMARNSASPGRGTVTQGTAGGGAVRHFTVRSSFLLTSITSQIEQSADKTRFARAHLNEGRVHDDFVSRIQEPASELLTPDFSRRFIARIVLRAPDYRATNIQMVRALTRLGLERRLADVFGSFATGAWLMLRDGRPEDEFEAASFIGTTFDIVTQIKDFGQEVGDEKDHTRLFRLLQSTSVRVESANFGPRMESMGALIASACGVGDGECCLSQAEAMMVLKNYGIRPAEVVDRADSDTQVRVISEGERGDAVVVHKNAEPIRAILKETGYARNYSQVMLQSSLVTSGRGTTRFSSAIGVGRAIVVPLAIFSLGEGDED